MINHQRHKRLLKLLDQHGTLTSAQLMAALAASAATLRRDLAWLASHRQLVRTRGGAQRLAREAASAPLGSEAFEAAMACHAAAKRAIARRAAQMCEPGETVIINGGSTTFMMAGFLPRRQLRILTNSFTLAERLLRETENQVILPGGSIYREQNVIVSPFEDDIARHHYAARMFMGVHALSVLGLMEADPLLLQAERRLIGQAEQLVVLVDSSKFNRRAGQVLCGLDRVACVITDTGAPDGAVQHLERLGVRVIAVEPEPAGEDEPDAAAAHGGPADARAMATPRRLIPPAPAAPAPSRAG